MVNGAFQAVKVTGPADGTAVEYFINPLDDKAKVAAFVIVPNVAIAAHDTNYITITITNGATTLATQTTKVTGGAAMDIGVAITMTLGANGVGTALEVAAGGVLKVAITESGTGPAFDFKVYTIFRSTRQ